MKAPIFGRFLFDIFRMQLRMQIGLFQTGWIIRSKFLREIVSKKEINDSDMEDSIIIVMRHKL